MGSLLGGGGGVSIPQRNLSGEWQDLKKIFGGQENRFEGFAQNKDPILKMLYKAVTPGGNIAEQLSALVKSAGESPLLKKLTGAVSGDEYLSGHVSEQELANVVSDPLLAKFAMQGNAFGNQAAAKSFLERDQYVEQRQKEHLGTAAGIEALHQGGLGATSGALAAAAGIPAGVLGAGVSAYTGLTNPILAFASDLFSSNQNAAAAQSVAGANKSAGTAGGIMSTIGSIAGAVGAAY